MPSLTKGDFCEILLDAVEANARTEASSENADTRRGP